MNDRRATLREAAGRTFDLIVVGGGINGAGIAQAAAERGYDVLLLDKSDWAFGTTWRSTKLVHGGLRYLEHGELGLVFESLRERAYLLRTAPHLVRPLPLLLPAYAGGRSLPLLRAGLTLYDLLALGGGLPRHRAMGRDQVLVTEPRLRREGLRGALAYWDAQVELPERLCLETVLRARAAGATALTYAHVRSIAASAGAVAGVQTTDTLDGGCYEFRAPVVINAAGPWVDEVLARSAGSPRVGGTRGTHLVARFPRGGPRRPIYAEAPRDRRPFFIIPWRGVHLIGTTDVRVTGPDDLLPSTAEITYLMEAANALLPGDPLSVGDVWYAYAGIRPLPYTPDGREGAITRRHHVVDHAADGVRGLFSVVGGKLSTYRSLAGDVLSRLPRLPAARARQVSEVRPSTPPRADDAPTDAEGRRLWRIYGPAARDLLRRERAEPGGDQPLCPHTLDTVAQAGYAIEREGALTVGDVLLRRTPAGWSECLGLDAAPRVAALLAELLGRDATWQRDAVEAYRGEVAATFVRPADICCFGEP